MARWRAPVFQSQLYLCESVTPKDASECCRSAARECSLRVISEESGKLILSPGLAGTMGGWKRASVSVAQQMVGAQPRASVLGGSALPRASVQGGILQQATTQLAEGIGVAKIKVEIKPGGACNWQGLLLEVTSCNTLRAEELIAAVGQRIEERFANDPAANGCKGRLEDFLESALPSLKETDNVKGDLRRKMSLHDWYASVRVERPVSDEEDSDDDDQVVELMGKGKSVKDWYNEGAVSSRNSVKGRTLTGDSVDSFVMESERKESFQMQEIRQKVKEF